MRHVEAMRLEMERENYETIYHGVSEIVKARASGAGNSLSTWEDRPVISSISSRLKTPESICRKLYKKHIPCTLEAARAGCADLIGVRIVTMYLDDIYRIAGLLKKSGDFKLLYEKDFIKRPKRSGYRSLHLIFAVPVFHHGETIYEKCEVQIRTMAMDSWAALEHQLIYKSGTMDKAAKDELTEWAVNLAAQDRKLVAMRKKIVGNGQSTRKAQKRSKKKKR